MQKLFGTVANRGGAAVLGATVTITTSTGAVAVIYSDDGITECDNPIRTNREGYWEFYAANGRYTVTTAGTNIETGTIADVLLYDPADSQGTGTEFLLLSSGSSFVGWIQSGIGAVLRWVQDKLRETVSVADYASFQQALNTGKVVRLVDGVTYPVASQLVVPTGGGIIGKGIIAASSVNFSATSKMIDSTDTIIKCEGVDNITLRDFKLSLTTTQNSWLYPISIRDVNKFDIHNVEATGINGGSLIKVDSSFDGNIQNTDLHDCTLDRTSTGQLTGVEVDGDKIASVGSERIKINHNTIRNLLVTPAFLLAYGFQTDGINVKTGAMSCSASHNIIDTVGEGIDWFGEDGSIIGNILKTCYIFGLKFVHGASRNIASLNQITDPGLAGICVQGSSTAFQDTDSNAITNNLVSGVNSAGNWNADITYAYGCTNNGIYVATNTNISGNRTTNSPAADYHIAMISTGAGNVANCNTSDGTPVAEIYGTNGVRYLQNRVGDDTGLEYISGTTPTRKVEEVDAAADEKLWIEIGSGGDRTFYAASDAGALTTIWHKILRTGTVVDLIQWAATVVKFGGITSVTKYFSINDSGLVTRRYDDAGNSVGEDWQNLGITASGQGFDVTHTFGTGGAVGGIAVRERVFSTNTWANLATRSARKIIDICHVGTIKRILDIDPAVGFQVSNVDIQTITAGKGYGIKSGANCKIGTATLVAGSAVVANSCITSTSVILPSVKAVSGAQGHLSFVPTAGVGFTATSSSGTDASTFDYVVTEPV